MPAPAIEIARCSSLRMAASACIQQERAQVLTHLAQNVRFLLTPWVFKCITCISQNKALLHCLQFCTFNGELYMVKHGIARSCKPGGGFDTHTHTHIHTHTHTQTDFQTSWLLWCLLWMFWTRLHVSWCGYLHHVLHTHKKLPGRLETWYGCLQSFRTTDLSFLSHFFKSLIQFLTSIGTGLE